MIEQKYADINMPGYLVFEIIDVLSASTKFGIEMNHIIIMKVFR